MKAILKLEDDGGIDVRLVGKTEDLPLVRAFLSEAADALTAMQESMDNETLQ